MRIVLATLNAKYIHSSLALRSLRAYAKADFPDIHLREYTIKEPANRIVADIYQLAPDVVAFSVYIWNVEETAPILRMLKQVLPNVKIVLGGPEVSYDTAWWMNRLPDVDVIVQGEGEATFHALLEAWRDAADVGKVTGLLYRDGETLHQNPPRGKLDLASIPSPYDEDELTELRNRIVYFETSRGCPFSCQFCLSSIESGVRYYPLEYVKRELTRLMKAGIRTIKFVDRTFNLNREYAVSLFQFLIDHRGDTVFQFEITGDILPPDIVEFLAARAPVGLFRFEIGVQSTNDATNAIVKRRQNFVKLSQTIEGIRQSGSIVQHLDLIAGLPEEDYASFRKTFDDVFQFEPDELQLGFLKMLRGTGLRKQAEQYGYVFMDVAPYEMFSNDVLSYDDVLKIKQVEDVLEKTWNESKLRHTVRYLTRNVYASAFEFFQGFGAFWEANGWDRIGHQLEDLYIRLDAFLQHDLLGSPAADGPPPVHEKRLQYDTAISWMMVDFLIQHRTRPHKVWWSRTLHRAERATLAMWLSQQVHAVGPDGTQPFNLTLDDLEKHAVIEALPRMIAWNETMVPELREDENGTLTNDERPVVVVHYPPGLAKGVQPTVMVLSVPLSISSWPAQDDRKPSAV